MASNLKIAMGCVFFHPEKCDVVRIFEYSDFFDKTLFWINGDKNLIFEKLTIPRNAFIFPTNENAGLSLPMNRICNQAIADGMDLVLFLDQDSIWDLEMLTKYVNKLRKLPSWSGVSMIGCTYNSNEYHKHNDAPKPVNTVITSGSVINLQLFNLIGGFDENLFIDEIDHDYGYSSKHKGYVVLRFEDIYFKHQIGSPVAKSFLGIQARNLHDPRRLYYIIRNYFYINRKHPYLEREILVERKNRIASRVKHNLFFNPNRFKVLYYIFLALFDFRFKRWGSRISID